MNGTVSAYAIEVYQENCSLEEMKSVLTQFANNFGCSLVVSPLHDKDLQRPNLNGERLPKKNHWHVLIHKSGTVESKDVSNISVVLGSNSHVESIDNEYNYFKYLKHDTLRCVRDGKPKYNGDYEFFTDNYLVPEFKGNRVNDLISLMREYYFNTFSEFVSFVSDNYPQYVTALSSSVVKHNFYAMQRDVVSTVCNEELSTRNHVSRIIAEKDKAIQERSAAEKQLSEYVAKYNSLSESVKNGFIENPFDEEEKEILKKFFKILDKHK